MADPPDPLALRPLLVVWPDRPDLVARFAERLSGVMPVVLDRRRVARRRQPSRIAIERRRRERRQLLTDRTRERFAALGYRLLYAPRADEGFEQNGSTPGFCGECERILDVELPRFVEPPARLDLDVQHREARGRLEHKVELEAFLPSGRLLLACTVSAREAR